MPQKFKGVKIKASIFYIEVSILLNTDNDEVIPLF